MSQKQFDLWNISKKETQKKSRLFFHEREVWMLRVGENIGYESSGKGKKFLRPVLITKKCNQDTFYGIPLTSQKKSADRNYIFLEEVSGEEAFGNLSQFRIFDAKRLEYKMGMIPRKIFDVVIQKIIKKITPR